MKKHIHPELNDLVVKNPKGEIILKSVLKGIYNMNASKDEHPAWTDKYSTLGNTGSSAKVQRLNDIY